MKKLLVGMLLAGAAFCSHADVAWSWWLENSDVETDFSFGLASRCKQVKSFELSFLYSGSPVTDGVQWTLLGLNDSDSKCPLQLAFINRAADPCVQLGFVNLAKSSVFDMGFANVADEAKFQLGFLNFNKKGFLPVFVFVNFDPSIFQ